MKRLIFVLLCFSILTLGSSAKIIEVAPAGAWGVLAMSGSGGSVADVTAPEWSSTTVAADGDEVTVVFSENLNDTALGGGEFDLDCDGASGADNVLVYSSGDGTSTWVFTATSTVQSGESCTTGFDGAANEAEDDAGNDLADYGPESVTNNSTQGGYEDFTTYSEVDSGTDITVTSSRVTWDTMTKAAQSWVALDKGEDQFSGNFTHEFEVYVSAFSGSGATAFVWALADSANYFQAIDDASGSEFGIQIYGGEVGDERLVLVEVDGGTFYSATQINIALSTLYYVTVWRNTAVGTYGTLYLAVYTDESKETQVGSTQSLTLQSSLKQFDYVYGLSSSGKTGTITTTAYVQNLNLN